MKSYSQTVRFSDGTSCKTKSYRSPLAARAAAHAIESAARTYKTASGFATYSGNVSYR